MLISIYCTYVDNRMLDGYNQDVKMEFQE